MFENRQINGYTYATRFIMSWVRAGGTLRENGEGYNDFYNWLLSLGLSKDDADNIMFLAKNGKMEFEYSAKEYLENLKQVDTTE